MMQTLKFQIGLMRFFGGVKPADQRIHAVCANSSAPTLTTFKFRNTQKTASFIACVCSFLVLNVARCRNITKVVKCIVARVPVNMVYIAGRPAASYIKPRQSVNVIAPFVDTNNRVSFGFSVPSNRPWNNFTARFNAPNKLPCFKIVVQQRTQLVKCDFGISHAISLP